MFFKTIEPVAAVSFLVRTSELLGECLVSADADMHMPSAADALVRAEQAHAWDGAFLAEAIEVLPCGRERTLASYEA